MLSKEEIENLLKDISQGFRKIPQVENILYPLDINQFQKLSQYIEQLETKNQKLIEKLEEDIKYYECDLLRIRQIGLDENDEQVITDKILIDKFKDILGILKGENDG